MRGDTRPLRAARGTPGAKRTQGVPRADGALVCPRYAGKCPKNKGAHTSTDTQPTNRSNPTPTMTPMQPTEHHPLRQPRLRSRVSACNSAGPNLGACPHSSRKSYRRVACSTVVKVIRCGFQ